MMEKNVSLKPYNTFGLDVSAKMLVHIGNVGMLQEILADRKLSA